MAQKIQISAQDIQAMVSHDLGTRPCGYLGSDYGLDLLSLLQQPFATGQSNAFITKMKTDVPVLTMLPANALSLGFIDSPPDKRTLVVDVAGAQLTTTGN
jgi:hypothetical protein